MKTRRSTANVLLDFTPRQRERRCEDAMQRFVEMRDNNIKWKQENERKKEETYSKGKGGGAKIKPNGLKPFAPTALKASTHTH